MGHLSETSDHTELSCRVGIMEGKTARHIRHAAKFNNAFGYLPHGYSEKSSAVTFDSSPKPRGLFLLQLFMYWSFVAYLSLRAIHFTDANTDGITISVRTHLQWTTTAAHYTVIPIQICALVFYGHQHGIINHYLKFQADLQVEWSARWPGKSYKSGHGFCRGLVILGVSNTLSNMMRIWRKPTAVNLITAIIPNVEQIEK